MHYQASVVLVVVTVPGKARVAPITRVVVPPQHRHEPVNHVHNQPYVTWEGGGDGGGGRMNS